MRKRTMSVAGMFYPNTKKELEHYIQQFSLNLDKHHVKTKAKAIIVPHAGYIYSGFTANLAYYFAQDENIKRIVVIGPSHKVYLQNSSISLFDEYETPLGNLSMDKDFCNTLQSKFDFLSFEPKAHFEHSTETQMPFVKYYFPNAQVVEIVYGQQDETSLSSLIDFCMEDEETLVVISTDLSHFYSLEEANILDNICLEAILHKNLEQFDQGCEACGMIGVKAVVKSALKSNLTVELLNYCTSYERSKDDSSVVGYTSFLIGDSLIS